MKGDLHVRFCERLAGETPACLLGLVLSCMHERKPLIGSVMPLNIHNVFPLQKSYSPHSVILRIVFHFGKTQYFHQRWNVHTKPATKSFL
ncbi:MAG: hypothetical protein JWP81_2186 [Ferruginibacter sp.]|nr:hypothetical protein [Ferruginibacter sp.]